MFLSKASQVVWLGRVTDFELLYEMSSLSCDAGEYRLVYLKKKKKKRENLWSTWFADDCCMEAVINDFIEHGKILSKN